MTRLIHVSLLFFFGLVVFLFPVNPTIAAVAIAIIAIVTTMYGLLTFLPLFYLIA
jgi:hypothetical protein